MAEKKLEGLNIWLPDKEGEELKGEVTEVNKEGDYGTQHTIKKDDGDEILTPSHKVLQNRLRNVKKGDTVRLVYTGKEAPKIKGYSPTAMYDAYLVE